MELKKLGYLLFIVVITAYGCTSWPNLPSVSAGTVRFGQPSNFNCFTTHNGTQKIKLWVNVKCRVYHNNSRKDYTQNTVTIDPSVTPFPVDIPLGLPENGRFEVEAIVHGVDCSECANGTSAPDEVPYGNCPTYVDNSTTPPKSRAANPRWNGTISFSSYQSVLDFPSIPRILNVPNSCGCLVNW